MSQTVHLKTDSFIYFYKFMHKCGSAVPAEARREHWIPRVGVAGGCELSAVCAWVLLRTAASAQLLSPLSGIQIMHVLQQLFRELGEANHY